MKNEYRASVLPSPKQLPAAAQLGEIHRKIQPEFRTPHMKGMPPSLLVAALCAANHGVLGAGQNPQPTQQSVPAAVKPGVVHFEDIARRVGITMQNFYG